MLSNDIMRKKEDLEILEFSEKKRPNKRKTSSVPQGWKNVKRRKNRMEDKVPKMLQLKTLEYSHLGQVEREDPDDESSPVDGNPNSVGEASHQ